MKIAVSGAAGRMGSRIVQLGHGHPNMVISGALEAVGNPTIGSDAGDLAGIGHLGVTISSDTDQVLQGCDCLIDFSAADASVEHVMSAASLKKAIVVGTTGFSAEQRSRLLEFGSATRCVIAPNMSPGMNLLYRLVEQAARAFGPEDRCGNCGIAPPHEEGRSQRDCRKTSSSGSASAWQRSRDRGGVRSAGNGRREKSSRNRGDGGAGR